MAVDGRSKSMARWKARCARRKLGGIGAFELLGTIYECVHTPQSVADEILAGNATGIVVPFPSWLRVEPDSPASERELLYELDEGEAHAILFARPLALCPDTLSQRLDTQR